MHLPLPLHPTRPPLPPSQHPPLRPPPTPHPSCIPPPFLAPLPFFSPALTPPHPHGSCNVIKPFLHPLLGQLPDPQQNTEQMQREQHGATGAAISVQRVRCKEGFVERGRMDGWVGMNKTVNACRRKDRNVSTRGEESVIDNGKQ